MNTSECFEFKFHSKLQLAHTAELTCWKFLLNFHFVSSIRKIHKI